MLAAKALLIAEALFSCTVIALLGAAQIAHSGLVIEKLVIPSVCALITIVAVITFFVNRYDPRDSRTFEIIWHQSTLLASWYSTQGIFENNGVVLNYLWLVMGVLIAYDVRSGGRNATAVGSASTTILGVGMISDHFPESAARVIASNVPFLIGSLLSILSVAMLTISIFYREQPSARKIILVDQEFSPSYSFLLIIIAIYLLFIVGGLIYIFRH